MGTIGYHTRLYSDNTVKVSGGSFGGDIDMETVERLTRLFDVKILPAGTAVFVDKGGREVRLYLSVDAGATTKGKTARADYRRDKEAECRLAEELEERLRGRLESVVDEHGLEEVLRRLRAP